MRSSTARLVGLTMALTLIVLLAGCGQNRTSTTEPMTSPVSPLSTPTSSRDVGGEVFAARFHSSWASGYPYPVFFYEVPYGETVVILEDVEYSDTISPLGGAHPRLELVDITISWTNAVTSTIYAENFNYDESQRILTTYDAYLNDRSLDTYGVDVMVAPGIGVAFLGDTSGVNIFYNCANPTRIMREELSTDEVGRPRELAFSWTCEGDSYEVSAEIAWESVLTQDINVIKNMVLSILREPLE